MLLSDEWMSLMGRKRRKLYILHGYEITERVDRDQQMCLL